MTTTTARTSARSRCRSRNGARDRPGDTDAPRGHGRVVTTKQIADASGVAAGTLFRVFDDQEAIIDAAVEHFLDPEPFRAALAASTRPCRSS